eukprot:945724-Pyramimonas_sp.AAC.1
MSASWGPLGTPLGTLLGRLRGLLGRVQASWGVLRRCCTQLGATLGRLEGLVGPSGLVLGPCWA